MQKNILMHKKIVYSHTDNLRKVRDFMREVTAEYPISTEDAYFIVMVVDEVCANRIVHTFKNNNKQEIQVLTSYQNGYVFVEISDEGDFFDIASWVPPDMKEVVKKRSPGGMGINLIRKIMDEVWSERKLGRNICKMFKKVG